jgi:hypothetical protein
MIRFKFSNGSLSRLKDVHPLLKEVLMQSIYNSPIDFGIPPTGGVRTASEQNLLYINKKSKADGYIILSKHQSGEAADVMPYVNKKYTNDPIHLSIIAGVILSKAMQMHVPIRWGGVFNSNIFQGWDPSHYELLNFTNRSRFNNSK